MNKNYLLNIGKSNPLRVTNVLGFVTNGFDKTSHLHGSVDNTQINKYLTIVIFYFYFDVYERCSTCLTIIFIQFRNLF